MIMAFSEHIIPAFTRGGNEETNNKPQLASETIMEPRSSKIQSRCVTHSITTFNYIHLF
jgi:hypothetical protein